MECTPLRIFARIGLSLMAGSLIAGNAMAGDQRSDVLSQVESITLEEAVAKLNAMVGAHEEENQHLIATMTSSSPSSSTGAPSDFVKAMIAVSDDPYDTDRTNRIELGDGITLITVSGEMPAAISKPSTFQLSITRALKQAEGVSSSEQKLLNSIIADIGAAPVRKLAMLPAPLVIDRVEIGASPVRPLAIYSVKIGASPIKLLRPNKVQPEGVFPPLEF